MQHHTTTSRTEAERLLGIAEKLLRNKDLSGCRDFAVLARETEPLLEGPELILAVCEVLLAADKRVNNQNDWYSILKIPQRANDSELIKKQYKQLVLLLHPDKNRLPLADQAFQFVADAWAVLSDPEKKTSYDNELSRFTKVDLVGEKKQQSPRQTKSQKPREDASQQKLPVRRGTKGSDSGGVEGGARASAHSNKKTSVGSRNIPKSPNFWTLCPYCYNLYEYPRVYEGCCLRCDNSSCKKTFTAVEIPALPPMVPGQEAYYCCWGFFPMGFVAGNVDGFQKCTPPQPNFQDGGEATAVNVEEVGGPVNPPPPPAPAPPKNEDTPAAAPAAAQPSSMGVKRKRGRPKKNF